MAIAVAVTLTFAISACGTTDAAPDPAASVDNVLAPAEMSDYPAGSVERTFLRFWSALQFQSWAEAAAYYDPRFREFVGTAQVISAKKQNGSSFPALKPAIVSVTKGPRGEKTVHYSLRFSDGSTEQASMTWRQVGDSWQIIYDSRLDAELAQLAQNRVEIKRTGALPTDASQPLSPKATRAASAASQLQAKFLQQELKAERP